MKDVEYADGKPINPHHVYATCTCAKPGCTVKIRYAAIEGTWRPRFCASHLAEEIAKIRCCGIAGSEAHEATHIQLKNLQYRTTQETISNESANK